MDALMRACSLDFGRSCFLVGEQYRLGTGGQTKDVRRARVWLRKACRLDVREACELGRELTSRRG
jgi:TPR repeat protein